MRRNRVSKMAVWQTMPSRRNPEGDENYESDEDQSGENDKFLRILNISRIMKRNLPPNAKFSNDATEKMQECLTEFIGILISEAVKKCKRENRKVINGDDFFRLVATLRSRDYPRGYMERGVQPNQVPQFSQPIPQSSFSQGPYGNNRQFSQPVHQSSFPQAPYGDPEFPESVPQNSFSQGPYGNPQFSQPAPQSSFSQAPYGNRQFYPPTHQSSFPQAPYGNPEFSESVPQNSFSQGPYGNPQFFQPPHQSSISQGPYGNPQFSQPPHQSSFSQAPPYGNRQVQTTSRISPSSKKRRFVH